MKSLIAMFLVLSSVTAFSQETIRLTPGNSVTLQPQTEVRVTCEGSSTGYGSVKFCQCRPSLYNSAFADLIQVIKTPAGQVQSEFLLYQGMYFNACYNAMVNHINCR